MGKHVTRPRLTVFTNTSTLTDTRTRTLTNIETLTTHTRMQHACMGTCMHARGHQMHGLVRACGHTCMHACACMAHIFCVGRRGREWPCRANRTPCSTTVSPSPMAVARWISPRLAPFDRSRGCRSSPSTACADGGSVLAAVPFIHMCTHASYSLECLCASMIQCMRMAWCRSGSGCWARAAIHHESGTGLYV